MDFLSIALHRIAHTRAVCVAWTHVGCYFSCLEDGAKRITRAICDKITMCDGKPKGHAPMTPGPVQARRHPKQRGRPAMRVWRECVTLP